MVPSSSGGIATPRFSIMRMTVCQPLAVYPAPTRLAKVWHAVHRVATSCLPFPSGSSSAQAGRAEHNRAAANKDEIDLVTMAHSRRASYLKPRNGTMRPMDTFHDGQGWPGRD